MLGAVLPLVFIPQLEDFLYYLRPIELIAAYGTAWLLLALLVLPVWGFGTIVLAAFGTESWLQQARQRLAIAVGALAAAIIAAALAYCVLVWLATFGVSIDFSPLLLWGVAAGGLIGGCTLAGRRFLERLSGPMGYVTLLGAICALSLVLFAWNDAHQVGTIGQKASVAEGKSAGISRPPHIVLLTIDALSADHMSLYGASRQTTPQLDAFAQDATTFQLAFANGNYTTPAVASILTGTRPWTHRAFQLQSWPLTDTRRASLPALLRQAGYQLGYVSTNAAAGADRNGLGRYFDFASRDRIRDLELCTDTLSSLLRYSCPVASMPLFGALMGLADRLHGPLSNAHFDPELAIAPALTWLQRADKRRPVFLWVHLFPPHAPYAAPPPWLGRFDGSNAMRTPAETEPYWTYTLSRAPTTRVRVLEDRYDEAVEYTDHYAGLFLQQALSLLGPDTVVVIMADHGESFHHGYGAHTGPGLYDEIIRVPLIIKLPGQKEGIRYAGAVEQIDIAPTLAQLAGLSAPASWEGRSLLPAWSSSQERLPERPVFSMNFEQNRRYGRLTTGSVAVIDSGWKLVHFFGHPHYQDMPPLRDQLYDIADDPLEERNLATRNRERVEELRRLIDEALARHGNGMSS